MESENELMDILTDLAGMHENRIHEYEDVVEKIKNTDHELADVMTRNIEQSHQLETELEQEMSKISINPPVSPFSSHKLQRLWMEIKSMFTGTDKKSVLTYAACIEHAMLKCYRQALESEFTMDIDIRNLINRHYTLIKSSYDRITEAEKLRKSPI